MRLLVGTKKPFTHIHSPLAKATRAKATIKLGNSKENSVTNDSAATRSRNSHITYVKNAVPPDRKSMSQ